MFGIFRLGTLKTNSVSAAGGANRPVTPHPVYTAAYLAGQLRAGSPVERWGMIKQANSLLATEFLSRSTDFHRRPSSGGGPGGLLEIVCQGKRTIFVGDLHANLARFNELMEKHTADLTSGKINLVFLGDILHPEVDFNMKETASSRELLDAMIMLKKLHPDNVHLVCGNHDTVLPGVKDLSTAVAIVNLIRGSGGQQTDLELARTLHRTYGVSDAVFMNKADFVKENIYQVVVFLRELIGSLPQENPVNVARLLLAYQEFFDQCPLAVWAEGPQGATYAAHAPIIKGLNDLEELVEARQNKLDHQLLWNKKQGANPNGQQNEYNAADVAKLLALLATKAKKPVNIVGAHEPKGRWAYQPYPNIARFTLIHSNSQGLGWVEISENGLYLGEQELRSAVARV